MRWYVPAFSFVRGTPTQDFRISSTVLFDSLNFVPISVASFLVNTCGKASKNFRLPSPERNCIVSFWLGRLLNGYLRLQLITLLKKGGAHIENEIDKMIVRHNQSLNDINRYYPANDYFWKASEDNKVELNTDDTKSPDSVSNRETKNPSLFIVVLLNALIDK